jgi:hypothetical protein
MAHFMIGTTLATAYAAFFVERLPGPSVVRVLQRMSRTAASLDCFFLLGMGHSCGGFSPSAKCLLTQSHFVSEFS